jgi:hypothetical protein
MKDMAEEKIKRAWAQSLMRFVHLTGSRKAPSVGRGEC